ncbi:MAG: DUF2293 domain-containing protein, partial [Methylococcaceae bacterium]|nr:DUF2293 domain-containing protein [Methylococcaceae bacterium]
RLAVIAHIRHAETPYDDLLASGCERRAARGRVQGEVTEALRRWRDG